jgi:PAS domain S-box-containing protein
MSPNKSGLMDNSIQFTRFQKIFKISPEHIALSDAEGKIFYSNPAIEAILGYSVEEYLQQDLRGIVHPEDFPTAVEHFKKLFQEPALTHTMQIRSLHKDGHYLWTEIRATNFLQDADVQAIIFETRNIHESMINADKLAVYNQRMKLLHEIDVGIISATNVETIVEVALTHVKEIIPCQAVGLTLYEQETDEALAYVLNTDSEIDALKGMRVPWPHAWTADFDENSVKYIENMHELATVPAILQGAKRLGLGSVFQILLKIEGQIVGLFNLGANSTKFFNQDYQEIALEISNQIAIAIRQLRLSEENISRRNELAEQIEKLQIVETALLQYQESLEDTIILRTNELQQAKEHHELILDNSFDAIVYINDDLRIQYANQAFFKLFAYEESPALGIYFLKLFTEDHILGLGETVLQHLQGGERKNIELSCRRADGSIFEAEVSIFHILQVEAQNYEFVVTIRDITLVKEHLRQLQYQASLQENVMDAVIVTDMNFRIQSWNAAAERIFGWQREEVIGRVGAEILQTEFSSSLDRDFYINKLRSEGAVTGEYIQRHKNGSPIHIFASTSIVKDEGGNPFAIVSINRDISERKRIELALNTKLEQEAQSQTFLKALHELSLELSEIHNMDEFYKRAVELGRAVFGFERLALFLFDKDNYSAIGTYGTDLNGKTSDERQLVMSPLKLGGILELSLNSAERFIFIDDIDLYTFFEPTGRGWNAAAAMWSGETCLGWLIADNALSHKAASPPLLDILALYAASLGATIAQKRIDTALRESEIRFRRFMEEAPIAIVVTNRAGNIVMLNNEAEGLLDYSKIEIIGQPIEILVPEVKRQGHQAKREAYTEKPHKRTMGNVAELFARRKDGGLFWADIQLSYIETEDDLLVMAFIEDISERKLAEEALSHYANELEDLYNNAPCGYHSLDSKGVYVAVNTTQQQWLGYDADELRDILSFKDTLVESEHEKFDESFALLKERGWLNNLEFELKRKDGSTFFVSLNATAIKDENGVFIMSRSTLFDITERKEVQRQLEKSLAKEQELGELKTRFVSMASHEFRTPLAVIKASTDLVMKHGERQGLDWSKQKLSKVSDQILHLTNIMEDVLDIGRLQSNRTVINPIAADFAELCLEIVEEFRARSDIRHRFELDISKDLPRFNFDRTLMRQVLSNLLSNAVKYSPEAELVHLSLSLEASNAILKIRDEGIGVPQADLERLFEPFHRAANVGTIQGTGMGLAITREIVEKHGGTIEAESVLKQGTTMTIKLPIT